MSVPNNDSGSSFPGPPAPTPATAVAPGPAPTPANPVTAVTELTIAGGERLRVRGDAEAIEQLIVNAARGSMMELAWLTEADSGDTVGVNPEHVVMLRKLGF